MHHDAQLRLCHERIGDDPAAKPANARWAWCELAAHAWCFDCDHYVCDIHFEARHLGHRTQLVTDEVGPAGDA